MSQNITLSRAVEAVKIPDGNPELLPAGTILSVSQALGDSYTVTTYLGYMYRIDAKDADALGLSPAYAKELVHQEGPFSEQMVWDQLKTIFDPEIPVNIVDLGLIYLCEIIPVKDNGHRINIKMSLTAPGCGMANVLKADVERKLVRLPGVSEVSVEVVFDPPWNPGRMSDAAKLQLGFDMDFDSNSSGFPILGGK